MKKQLTHGSLFSGIGGFELGAHRAGIKTSWNCEIEEFTRRILKNHFPQTKQYTDIKLLTHPDYVDIISGGFPCQDISTANAKAKGIKGKRSGLWKEMYRVITEVKPKYVIIENSPMLSRRGLDEVLRDLAKSGYHAQWQCLRARDFGLPHKRERIFVVAYPGEVGRKAPAMERGRATAQRRNTPQERVQDSEIFERSSCLEFIKKAKKAVSRLSESEFSRADDGVSKKLDRAQALGNAVVPLIAQYIFERIKHREGLGTGQLKEQTINALLNKAIQLKEKLSHLQEHQPVSRVVTLHGLDCIPTHKEKELQSPNLTGLGKVSPQDIYNMITERIIEVIKKNPKLAWQQPWTTKNSTGLSASNYVSKKPYRGINSFMLNVIYPLFFKKVFKSPYFLTFKQVQDLDGKVKKGTKGYEVFYFNVISKLKGKQITEEQYTNYFERCAEGEVVENDLEVCKELGQFALIKYYHIYSADDVEGIDFKLPKKTVSKTENEKIEVCEAIVANYPKPAPKLIFDDPNGAYYLPSKDVVNMLPIESVHSSQSYYSILFHELIHSTGHPNRIDRFKKGNMQSKEYAFEELIAELGASYLNAESGILYFNLKNSAAYLKGWRERLLKHLEEDNKFFFSATSAAQKAADFILQYDEKAVPQYLRKALSKLTPKTDKLKTLKVKAKALQLKLKLENV